MKLKLNNYLLFLLLSILLTLIVVEIILRLFQPKPFIRNFSAPAFGLPTAVKANLNENSFFIMISLWDMFRNSSNLCLNVLHYEQCLKIYQKPRILYCYSMKNVPKSPE